MKLYADVNKCGVLFWESNAGEVNARTLEVEMCENLCSCAQQFVVFTLEDGTRYISKVKDGVAELPVFQKSQYVTIGLYGSNIENDECVLRYSPQPVKVFVNAGSYTTEGDEAINVTTGTLEELLAEINKASAPITSERIEDGAVNIDKVNTLFFNDGLKFIDGEDIKLQAIQLKPNKALNVSAALKNKVASITAESTDGQIPTAKAVFDYALAKSNVVTEFDIEKTYTDNEVYNANAFHTALMMFSEMIEQMAQYFTDHENRIKTLEQQAGIASAEN